MKKKLFIATCILLSGNALFAQSARFTTSGSIEFEKRSNMFAIIQRTLAGNTSSITQQVYDQYKKTQPQFKVCKSTMLYGNGKSLYTPAPVTDGPNNFFNAPMADPGNTVYTDFATNTSTSQKKLFDEVFLVKDTVRKVKWKITDETREIAGYTCRRANAVILDSIYVVAFYTDNIPVSGGPESFAGLPGMILEVAMPHENITWTATKVTDVGVNTTDIVPPKKGKAVDNKGMLTLLAPAIKNYGNYAQPFLKALAL
jgi:GLPGLI family protein